MTPRPPAVAGFAGASPAARRNQMLVFAAIVVVLVVLVRACSPSTNPYERVARGMTLALQHNDVDAVKTYQNAETATQVNRARVGHAADVLAPLGKLQRVRENTPQTDGERVHEFDLTFEHGALHEKMKFDPQNKIVRFQYDLQSNRK